jgi:hypothetical protein
MFGLGDMASRAAQGTGSFFGGLVGAPLNAVAGLARGAIGSVWSGVMVTGLITALKLFSPELWRSALVAIGGQKLAEKTAKTVKEDGIPGVIRDSAIEGFGLAATWGGAKGMIESATGQQEGASGLGTILGTGVVMAVVGSVVIGAMNKNGVKPAGEADAGAKQPAATPPAAAKGEPVAPKK